MNITSLQIKLLAVILSLMGLAYHFTTPYLAETKRIETQATKLRKELDELKRQASVYGSSWEIETKKKETLLAEKLPDAINAAATLNYLLNQFEQANAATVHFLSASHQASTASGFKIPGQKGTMSPRVSRYRLRSRMKQQLIVPYLEHVEKLPATHNLENMTISLPKTGDPSLEIEVTVGVYLAPKEWVPKEKLVGEGNEDTEQNSDNWKNWFQETPLKPGKNGNRELAESITSKNIKFKISKIVGDGIVVDENLYEEGDSIQGWRIFKVDSAQHSVTFKSGNRSQTVTIK